MVVSHERHCNIAKSREFAQEQKWKALTSDTAMPSRAVASHSRSVKRCAPDLAPQIYGPAFIVLRSKIGLQVGSASLYRPATRGPTAAARAAAARRSTA